MNKPFEVADLLERLKAQGMPMLEKDAKLVTSVVLDWTADSCVMEGGVVAMIAAGIPYVKEQVIRLEDKIDGIAGN